MKLTFYLLLILGLVACSRSEAPETESGDSSVEELAVDPAYLKELRQQCKTDRTSLGDVLCDRVTEAARKRFYGDGTAPYALSDMPPKF